MPASEREHTLLLCVVPVLTTQAEQFHQQHLQESGAQQQILLPPQSLPPEPHGQQRLEGKQQAQENGHAVAPAVPPLVHKAELEVLQAKVGWLCVRWCWYVSTYVRTYVQMQMVLSLLSSLAQPCHSKYLCKLTMPTVSCMFCGEQVAWSYGTRWLAHAEHLCGTISLQVAKLKASRDKLLEQIDKQWEELDRVGLESKAANDELASMRRLAANWEAQAQDSLAHVDRLKVGCCVDMCVVCCVANMCSVCCAGLTRTWVLIHH